MAAGLGTRLRPFTEHEPKCLIPVMGIPIAQFAIDLLRQVGVGQIVANVHHLPERALVGLMSLDRGTVKLEMSDERDLLLGSAGGIRKALPILTSNGNHPFYLLNADVLSDLDLKGLARAHARLRARFGVRMTLMVFPQSQGSGAYREIIFDEGTHVITGLGQVVSGKPFFVGAAVIEPEAVEALASGQPAEFVPSLLEPAIQEGKAGVYLSSGEWYDVGSPRLWLEAHLAMIRLLETRPPLLWSQRVQSVNKRIAPGVWVSKNASRCSSTADWAQPVYWNPLLDETARPPKSFGPRAVLYGGAWSDSLYQDMISYRGLREMNEDTHSG